MLASEFKIQHIKKLLMMRTKTILIAHTGVAVADFVIFPPRLTVAKNTFRPPY